MSPPTREPLDAEILNADIGSPWSIEVAPETDSTNADLLRAAAAGTPPGLVRIAEFQHSGRGRLDRAWTSPVGAGLTMSLLLRPSPPVATWGWLPLLTGLALARTVGEAASVKWPNDLLLGPEERKAAGILVQAAAGAAVVGLGINVSTTEDELAVPSATSLALQGLATDRAELLARFLREFEQLYFAWTRAGGRAGASGLATEFRQRCSTLGRPVTVVLEDEPRHGYAQDIDEDGRLVVLFDGAASPTAIAAGDVTHLRPDSR
jgi:BirA family biotin operon repressor/biotin-[acetyl-CoA-carboxylase] ligase